MKQVLEGIIETISSRADGSLKLSIGTQEISSEDAGKLFGFRGKFVKVLISDTNITELEVGLIDAHQTSGTKKKSKSQRLRAILYRVWEQQGTAMEFDQFYDTEMENLILKYKEVLN